MCVAELDLVGTSKLIYFRWKTIWRSNVPLGIQRMGIASLMNNSIICVHAMTCQTVYKTSQIFAQGSIKWPICCLSIFGLVGETKYRIYSKGADWHDTMYSACAYVCDNDINASIFRSNISIVHFFCISTCLLLCTTHT